MLGKAGINNLTTTGGLFKRLLGVACFFRQNNFIHPKFCPLSFTYFFNPSGLSFFLSFFLDHGFYLDLAGFKLFNCNVKSFFFFFFSVMQL